MKIGLLCVSYLDNERQLLLAENTLRSFVISKDILKMCIINGGKITDFAYNYFDIIDISDNCLSKSWNKGIKHLIEQGCDYVIVMNLDIIIHDPIDNLIDFALKKKDGVIWTGKCLNSPRETPERITYENCWDHFSFFMVDKTFFKRVGEFDENYIPAYYEDEDMIWRIHLLKEKAYCCQECRFFHHGQTTNRNEKGILTGNLKASPEYFIRKWNGVREHTGYNFPFNDPKNPIKWYK